MPDSVSEDVPGKESGDDPDTSPENSGDSTGSPLRIRGGVDDDGGAGSEATDIATGDPLLPSKDVRQFCCTMFNIHLSDRASSKTNVDFDVFLQKA